MKTLISIDDEFEFIWDSLADIQRAKAPQFLYAKIRAKLEKTENDIFKRTKNCFTQPAVVVSVMCVILFADAIAITILRNADNNGAYHSISNEADSEETIFYILSDLEIASEFQ